MTELSLFQGGPLHRIGRRAGILRRERSDLLRRSGVFIAIGWVPVLILAAFDPSPLAQLDLHVRWLIGVPALFAAESRINGRIDHALWYLTTTGIVPNESRARFDRACGSVARWRDSSVLELLVLVGSFAMSIPALRTSKPPAEVWHLLVGLPLYRFLLGRFLLRWFAWIYLLLRISRLDLRLVGTHPDRNGGLTVLGEASRGMALFGLGFGAVAASTWANRIIYDHAEVADFNLLMVAVLLLVMSLAFLPLLAFFQVIRRTKDRFLHEYAALLDLYAERFHQKWIHPNAPDPLGHPDMQSFADLGSVFEVVDQMSPFIVTRRAALTVAGWTALPMLPLLLFEIPAGEIMQELVKIVM